MNSELLYITKKLGYPSSFGARAGLGDFLEQYPDGIYAENGGGAPIGWESAAVWFGGDSERSAARFERMMSERNELSRLFRTRVSGVLVLTFIYRLKSRMVTAIPIASGQPQPIDPTWLYFTMPQGGTITLTKNGTPTAVTLEYSLDNGSTWTEWVESENVRSLTLAAGQTMHVRNTSETSTGFSTSATNYYNFAFSSDTYAGGNTDSLLCKNPENSNITSYCYSSLFANAGALITAPILPNVNISPYCYFCTFLNCVSLTLTEEFTLPAINLRLSCYRRMFSGCKSLTLPDTFTLLSTNLAGSCYREMFSQCENLTIHNAFTLPATILAESCYDFMFRNCKSLILHDNFVLSSTTLSNYCYREMFSGCTLVDTIKTNMTDISATDCIKNWLSAVSPTGDFYCPAELTIPTGPSGIPSGWTRHDI